MAAPPPPPTYEQWVPPPPLPEFYRKAPVTTLSSSTEDPSVALVRSETQVKISGPGRAQVTPPHEHGHIAFAPLPAKPPTTSGDGTVEVMKRRTMRRSATAPIVTIQHPHLGVCDDVPPLAVYHICRICLRPRSARYHHEHPIPINGLPPPPTICRRCRVTPVSDISKTEVVVESESNDMKIGIGCLMPDENYVTAEQMKEMRGRKILRSLSKDQRGQLVEEREVEEEEEEEPTEPEREIIYRHVRVRRRSVSRSPGRPRPTVTSTAQDAINESMSDLLLEPLATTATAAATSKQAQPSQKPSSRSTSIKFTAAELAKHDSAKDSSSSSRTVSAKAQSVAKVIAQTSAAPPALPERTESEIRKIAREEIERYRQAERKMGAHRGPYAHGQMVPVERRISRVADNPEPMPWRRGADDFEVIVSRQRDYCQSPPKQRRDTVQEDDYEVQAAEYHKSDRAATSERPRPGTSEEVELPRKANVRASALSTSKSELNSTQTTLEPRAEPGREIRRESTRSVSTKQQSWGPRWFREQQSDSWAPNAAESTATQQRNSHGGKAHLADDSRRSLAVPESDLPRTLRLREMVEKDGQDWVASRSQASQPKEYDLPPPNKHNVVEVIEDYERFPEPRRAVPQARSRTISRAQSPEPIIGRSAWEKESDLERKDRYYEASAIGRSDAPSARSSKATDRLYWLSGGIAGTASSHGSRREDRETFYRHEEMRADVDPESHSASERVVGSTKFGRKTTLRQGPDPDAWTSERSGVKALPRPDDKASQSSSPPRPVDIQAKVRSFRSQVAKSRVSHASEARSTQSSKPGESSYFPDDSEYMYTLRTVTPLDRPLGSRPFDQALDHQYKETEEYIRRRRKPRHTEAPPSNAPSQGTQKSHHTTKSRVSEAGTVGTVGTQASQATQKSTHTTQSRVSEVGTVGTEGTRSVRFSSKVEISPTPPNSDASSSQFRIIGGPGKRTRIGQLDGSRRSPERESGADLVTEYERRGRARNRETLGTSTDQGRLMWERVDDVEREYVPSKGHTERARRDSGDSGETVSQVKKNTSLARALSESPSRERLNEMFKRGKAKEAEPSSSRPGSSGVAGPYRAIEPSSSRPNSMDVEDGSNAPSWWSKRSKPDEQERREKVPVQRGSGRQKWTEA